MTLERKAKKDFSLLLSAQFLTAFADNALLFTAIAMVMQQANSPDWYVPVLQACFLIAFVVLAPWVSVFADVRPKANVLAIGNSLKAFGALLMFLNIEPLLAYALVGLGAAVYSPAKYGILPELMSKEHLVKGNSWIEGSTIIAILVGMLFGAKLADYSISLALSLEIGLYVLSGVLSLFISCKVVQRKQPERVFSEFKDKVQRLFSIEQVRYALLAISLFWAASVALRLMIIAWAPVVLLINDAADVAALTIYTGLGIAVGAALVPKFIPLEQLRRTRFAAYALGISIVALSFISDAVLAKTMLFVIGVAGGVLVVPINAVIQEKGHHTVGSGGAVAVQNFLENLSMLAISLIYSLAAKFGATPTGALLTLGVAVIISALWVVSILPKTNSNTGR